MDVYEIRRARMRQLIDTRFDKVQARFAEAIERQPDYVSRCLKKKGEKGAKRIGEDIARDIEEKLGLAAGWMSTPTPDDTARDVPYWPFGDVPPTLYRRLPDEAKAHIEKVVTDQAKLAGLIHIKSTAKPKGARNKKAA